MPQRTSSGRLLIRLVLFTFAGWLLWALGKEGAETDAVKRKGLETTSTRAKVIRLSVIDIKGNQRQLLSHRREYREVER